MKTPLEFNDRITINLARHSEGVVHNEENEEMTDEEILSPCEEFAKELRDAGQEIAEWAQSDGDEKEIRWERTVRLLDRAADFVLAME